MFKIEDFLNKITICYVWLCFTDRCNLNCDYCFFRYRSNHHTLSWRRLKVLFDSLPNRRDRKYRFIISGGEPLMEWELVKQMSRYISGRFLNYSFVLQTNGVLLDEEKARFLKEYNYTVEHGIDGKFLANFRHRQGLSQANFKKVLKSIEAVLKYKIPLNPTMAVHPQEAKEIFENFKYLVDLGLYSMDVHPVLFGPWLKEHAPIYLQNYKKIIRYEVKARKFLVNKDYNDWNMLKGPYLDFVVLPDGNILPNWVYLMLTPELKQKYSILKINDDGITANKEWLKKCLKAYAELFKNPRTTYRDFSNLNVEIMLKELRDKQLNEYYKNYKSICDGIREFDQQVLLNTIWQREKLR